VRYPLYAVLTCVRGDVACPQSLRYIEEMMQEHGVTRAAPTRWPLETSRPIQGPMS